MRSLTAVLTAALVLLPAAPASAQPVNQPPVVVDDAIAIPNDFGPPHVIRVLDNDSDPDGDALRVTAVGTPAKGTLQQSLTVLYYDPLTGRLGDDSFTYTASDERGGSTTGTVTVTLYEPLPGPGGVSGSSSPGSFALAWSAVDGAAGYRIYRNDFVVGTSTTTSWTDDGLNDAGGYRYRVTAMDVDGHEGNASYPEVYRAPRPSVPAWLEVDPTNDDTSLELTWDPQGQGQGQGHGSWRVWRDGVAVTTTQVPTFVDTGLIKGDEYSYQVSRVTELESALSAPVTGTPGVLTAIGRLFRQLGGPTGSLGPVTVAERAVPGGRRQDHGNGIILQRDGADPVHVWQFFAAPYDAAGGSEALGFPLWERQCGLRDGGCSQFFEGGSVWDSNHTQTVVVPQVMEDGWAASGWEEGPLGYPVDDVVELPDGFAQEFEGGGVFWSEATGSHGVSGAIGELWVSAEGTEGRLGYPTTDEICGLRDDGCLQRFQGGSIYWSPAGGPHVVLGAIRSAWARQGWENGALGYPTTSEICGLRGGGCGQAFQGGSIHWSPATGAQVTTGAIRNAWARSGWENGALGYPTTGELCGLRGRGCGQAFQGGSIHWSPASGAQATTGAVRDAWARQGWENGRLGYPVSGETFSGGAYRQTFQGGTITVPASTGVPRITYR